MITSRCYIHELIEETRFVAAHSHRSAKATTGSVGAGAGVWGAERGARCRSERSLGISETSSVRRRGSVRADACRLMSSQERVRIH
jgi:hypothetical protein